MPDFTIFDSGTVSEKPFFLFCNLYSGIPNPPMSFIFQALAKV